jgi:hypothetical protein
MSGSIRRNENRFYRYPRKRVVAVVDDDRQLQAALRDLSNRVVDLPDIDVLSGPEGARLLDRSGAGHGLRARLLRLLQWGAYESDALSAHERALNDGHHVVYVPVRDEKAARQVAEILSGAGAHYLLYFGTWTVGQLPV